MLPFHDPWFGYGVPLVAVALGLLGYAWARRIVREFDRQYGAGPRD